ncbi:MAG: hypothetical protein AAFZ17_13685 [Cyanobacteria bacterium J06650_10]
MTEQNLSQNTSNSSVSGQTELDILTRLGDPQWAIAAAQVEDEANCDISAGRDWGSRLGTVLTNPDKFYQHQRLRSHLLRALHQLLVDCDLGAGLTSAQTLAKQRLFQRLQEVSSEAQTQLTTVLAEDSILECVDSALSESAKETLQSIVRNALTTEDWDSISTAATVAIQQHIRRKMTLPETA